MPILRVDVVSAEGPVYAGDATFVALPVDSGELGILPRHAPMVARIKLGAIRIRHAEGVDELVFVAGGLLEVQRDSVTVLADTAIRGQDLPQDTEVATKGARGDIDFARAHAELISMATRILSVRKLRRQ